MKKICKTCGSIFEASTPLAYCSVECKKIARSKQQKTFLKTCARCGTEYTTKHAEQAYCSYSCATAKGWDNRGRADLKEQRVYVCSVCGKESTRVTCARECELEKGRRRAVERYRVQIKKKECKWCGDTFVSEYKSGRCDCCCEEHKELYKRKQEKEHNRLHKGAVSKSKRLRVYERDNYICQLCGSPLRMDAANTLGNGKPHLLAPTVDHIFPVSLAKQAGWSKISINAETNLQAAHFICNIRKGNDLGGMSKSG